MNEIRVLVIDDETALLKMLDMALSRKGYQVDTAGSGKEGINKLESNDYDLVITDMVMGNMSGKDTLHEIRQLKGESLPVIAMSGTPWLMDDNLFDAVLPKPFSLQGLFEMVNSFLSPPHSRATMATTRSRIQPHV